MENKDPKQDFGPVGITHVSSDMALVRASIYHTHINLLYVHSIKECLLENYSCINLKVMIEFFTLPSVFLTISAVKTGSRGLLHLSLFSSLKRKKQLFVSFKFFRYIAILDRLNLRGISPSFNVSLMGVNNFMHINPQCYDSISM